LEFLESPKTAPKCPTATRPACFGGTAAEMAAKIEFFQEIGYPALEKLDDWLSGRDWLVAGRYTLADLGVFPYVSMASEGGYDMTRFPAIDAWLARVKPSPAGSR